MEKTPPPPTTRRSFLLVAVLLLFAAAQCNGETHNITKILAEHPQFSTFNHYLTATHLATEINRRLTITVLVVDNGAMDALLSKNLSIFSIKNVLSLHVLTDYFGAKKLHQITDGTALVSTVFQASGSAAGTSGFVNITNLKAGKVGFGTEDNGGKLDSFFVKSVKEAPYKISVIQISRLLRSPEAEAPTPSPSEYNLTELMTKKGCKVFADLLAANADVEKMFESNVDGGLSVFCPIDQAMHKFMPKYKNLTADGKSSLLLYHGVPVYNSIQMLKSGNGVANTLATDGTTKNYNFTVQNDGEVVTLRTKISTSTITGTVIDEQPLAVYTVDEVLEPRELFKVKEVEDAPAPAPAKSKKHKAAPSPEEEEEEAFSPDDDVSADDVTADDNAGGRVAPRSGGMWAASAAVAVVVIGIIGY